MRISNRHVLVTGAGKRIGKAIADNLLKTEKEFCLSLHSFQTKFEMPQPAANQKVNLFQADLTSEDEARQLLRQANKASGPVEILIHCASLFYPTPINDITASDFGPFFKLHVQSALCLAQEMKRFLANREGVIVFFLDVFAQKPLKNYLAYSVSKAALKKMTTDLAKEFAPTIRVNALSPGTILPQEGMTEEQRNLAIRKVLINGWGPIEAVVGGLKFLIENDYVTGFDLLVDGGRSIQS